MTPVSRFRVMPVCYVLFRVKHVGCVDSAPRAWCLRHSLLPPVSPCLVFPTHLSLTLAPVAHPVLSPASLILSSPALTSLFLFYSPLVLSSLYLVILQEKKYFFRYISAAPADRKFLFLILFFFTVYVLFVYLFTLFFTLFFVLNLETDTLSARKKVFEIDPPKNLIFHDIRISQ